MAQAQENVLATNKHILLVLNSEDDGHNDELQHLRANFCGVVVDYLVDFNTTNKNPADTWIYLCGDAKQLQSSGVLEGYRVFVVRELSKNYDGLPFFTLVNIHEVPVHYKNIGVYFRQAFPGDKDYFGNITSEHTFQALTESNKPNNAFRTGIYLTRVVPHEDNPEALNFHLLRCSSNLNGPSDNFRKTDNEVVGRVNELAAAFYEAPTDMNHVLAQVYENRHVTTETGRSAERKAKIKDHSDKTKDMDPRGLIAFVTFYRQDGRLTDNPVALTRLRFRRKHGGHHVVDVVLHPNSVLLISLSTNRIYTHEIIPSILSIDQIPTRLGYVVRCSNTRAVFKDGKTFMEAKNKDTGAIHYVPLAEADSKSVRTLRELYFAENTSDDIIHYPEIYFSMNNGDYWKPLL